MSDIQKTDEATPACPLCTGATTLKEILPHASGLHYFFKCIVCAVEYPVVKLLKRES